MAFEFNYTNEEMFKLILDSIPYPIVFCDTEHIIRYMNKEAEFFYYRRRGYGNLIGKSLFDCHSENTKAMIEKAVTNLENHGNEIYLGVNNRNQRKYINPVRDENGKLLGYFERFEMNLEK
ncbi:MAG: PAS domain-containing protein [Clostridia bacterium]|nr:PAS domain-containing protein [Clostridia bacterium]